MSRGERPTREHLQLQRRELEADLHGIRTDLEAGIGWLPKGTGTLLLGLAASAGFALAVKLFRRGGAQDGDSESD